MALSYTGEADTGPLKVAVCVTLDNGQEGVR